MKKRRRVVRVIKPVEDDPFHLAKKVDELVNKSPFGVGTYGITSSIDNKSPKALENHLENSGAEEIRKPLVADSSFEKSAASSPTIKKRR
ncbi:MAG: hypothetical protein HYW86_03020 [Candidatus Roizmanbacteria bacterium]|nr:MAG: hypothetical protein HYW86_03020 [Candidatus Roizmanbacteria bacterium]